MQSSFKTFAQQLMSEFETKVEFEPNAEVSTVPLLNANEV